MKISRLLFSGMVVLFLSACAPMYETQYSYTPPDGAQAMVCVQSCEMTRMQCQMMEDGHVRDCEDRADRDYDWCMNTREHRDDYCSRDYCGSADYSMCDSRYNSCYEACGGKVTPHQVCVAFCEQ